MRIPVIALAGALLLLALLPLRADAQANQGSLRGTVVDDSGAAIPGVAVAAEGVGTRARFTAVTNENGAFAFLSLPPSTYQITAELEGFKRAIAPNVAVHIGEITRVDLILRVGAVAESVQVGGVLRITPDTATAGTVVTATEFEKLPLAGSSRSRIPTDFALMTPGVIGGQQRPGRDHTATTNLSVDGSQNSSTDVLVDGMSAGQFQSFGSFTEVGIPVDAIQEFNLIKGIMPAEYGYVQTGLLSFSLKSGTNSLHGSAFHNFRHDALNARSYFEQEKLPFRHNNFGGTVSGPVRIPGLYDGESRTFFMASYDRSIFRGTSIVRAYTSPTEAFLRGDFSNLRLPNGQQRIIYDPATGVSDGRGGVIRQPFPNNIIPEDRLSPIAKQVAALIPAPNRPGTDANFVGRAGAAVLDNTFFNTKIDHRFTPRHSVSGSFNYTHLPRETYNNPYEGTPLLTGLNQDISSRSVRLAHDFIVSDRTLNQWSFGYNRFHNQSASFSKGEDWPARLGLEGVGGDGSMPVFQFSSDGYPKMGLERWDGDVEENVMLRNTTTMARGRHTIKFGVEMRHQRSKPRQWRNQAGTFNFSFRETSLNGSSTTGNSFASFLLGYVDEANISTPLHVSSLRPYYAGFVQDDVKLTPRLTLNIGLRYEIDRPPSEQYDRASTFDLTTPNPGAGNLPGAMLFAGEGDGRTGRRTFEDTYDKAFGPRIGLAWQLTGRTVVRGGYGVSHSSHRLLNSYNGFSTTQAFTSPDRGNTPAFLLDDGMPTNWPRPPFIDPTFGNRNNVSTTIPDRAARMPKTDVWRVDVQHELPGAMVIEVAYVGTRGSHLSAEGLQNLNQVDPQYLALGSLLTADINSPAARQAGIPIPYAGFTGTVAQALRPYPHVLNVSSREDKLGSSMYHAGQFKAQKRFARGLQFLASYTFSKMMTDVPDGMGGVSSSSMQNAWDREAEWAVAPFDTPHAFALSSTVDLPFGDGRRWLNRRGIADALLGGWNLSVILSYQSGIPLRVTQNNQLALFNSSQRPNRVPGVDAGTDVSYSDFDPAVDRLLNQAAFAPAGGSFGDAPPRLDDVREFGIRSEDLSLRKTLRFGDQLRSELNVQVFNLFDRPYWGTANVNHSASDFGRITTAGPGRFVQLGLKLYF